MVTRRKYRTPAAPAAPVVADEPVAAAPASSVAPGPAADGRCQLAKALAGPAARRGASTAACSIGSRSVAGTGGRCEQRAMVDQHVDGIPPFRSLGDGFYGASDVDDGAVPASMMFATTVRSPAAGIADNTVADGRGDPLALAAAEHPPPSQQLSQHPRTADVGERCDASGRRPGRRRSGTRGEATYGRAPARAGRAAPPPSPKRRSMPMSAPVSRDYVGVSGRPFESNSLSRDERDIARSSFPHLPAPEAEYEYLKNKRRMHEDEGRWRNPRVTADGARR